MYLRYVRNKDQTIRETKITQYLTKSSFSGATRLASWARLAKSQARSDGKIAGERVCIFGGVQRFAFFRFKNILSEEKMVISVLLLAALCGFQSFSNAFPQAVALFSPKITPNSWHGGGINYWNRIKDIVPKSYEVQRVKDEKPVRFEDGDIFSDCWDHAPWTDPFVDIEGPEKYGPTR